ncbi:hypothetical protein KKIDH5335_46380 (plasmid) [Vibrio fluvialis]|nr:hypothetical protein KKIDH5335_46380 [Vibrio fluvialis]
MKQYQFAINQIKHDYLNIVSENDFKHLDFNVESRIALRLISNSALLRNSMELNQETTI